MFIVKWFNPFNGSRKQFIGNIESCNTLSNFAIGIGYWFVSIERYQDQGNCPNEVQKSNSRETLNLIGELWKTRMSTKSR